MLGRGERVALRGDRGGPVRRPRPLRRGREGRDWSVGGRWEQTGSSTSTTNLRGVLCQTK
jgi:hypothetical protein